jgi:hypothetical protein
MLYANPLLLRIAFVSMSSLELVLTYHSGSKTEANTDASGVGSGIPSPPQNGRN